MYTADINAGSTWTETRDIEYKRFNQATNSYEPNLVVETTINYKVTGFNETKTVNGNIYEHVNTYLMEYTFNNKEMYREFMLANNVGLIRFEDQDEYFELKYFN